MTKYKIQFTKDSKKFLKKTDKVTQKRVAEAIFKLSINPFEYADAKKVQGYEDKYRIQVGKYRILYEINDGVLIIVVLDIDSRGGIYKRI